VRRSHSVRRFVDRLGSGHSVLERTNTGAPPDLFGAGEAEFLDLVDGKTPVKELCQKGAGTEKENARSLYAFFCLDLVRIREAGGARKLQWKTEGGALGEGE
jgi:hypothetical protein